MNIIDALRQTFGGVYARLAEGAYAPVSMSLPPLSWYGHAPGATGDYASDQRYTRPYNLYAPEPHPADGIYGVPAPFRSVHGTVDIYTTLDNDTTRLPSGPYMGSALGVNIVGGMTWGPTDVNGWLKQMGAG